jgi:hypothetical protein
MMQPFAIVIGPLLSNPNKAKGTRWEVSVADYLRAGGFTEAFRLAPGGFLDAGDIGGIRDFAFECRDKNAFELSNNVKDANDRAIKKNCSYGAAVLKKRGDNVENGYVVLDIKTFVRLLQEFYDVTGEDNQES